MGGLGFFNVGLGEMVFILVMAGLFLGPHRIRIVARWLGQMTVKSRTIYREFMHQLNSELDESGQAELKGALDDIRRLQSEMRDLRNEIISTPQAAIDEAKSAVEEAQAALNDDDRFPTENNMAGPVISAETLAPPPSSPAPPLNNSALELPQIVEVEDDPA